MIITVIVMLILVGVTINVALNGGLFTQAQTAANDTQIQADKEQLLSAIVASYDIETGTIKSESELRENLGNDWTVVKEDSVYKVTSPKENVFTVDAKGNIDGDSKKSDTPEGDDTETPNFYGVAYKAYHDSWWYIYFFKDGNAIIKLEKNDDIGWLGTKYLQNGNEISVNYLGSISLFTGEFKENYSSIVTPTSWGTFTRDEGDVVDWTIDSAPVCISINGCSGHGEHGSGFSLENTSFQEKGKEYKTKIIIDDGNQNVTDYELSLEVVGTETGKTYIVDEDYLYNSTTGEITIPSLNEVVGISIKFSKIS